MVPAAATRFVILTAGRTGSNMLCTLLNSHPEILCHHEIFNNEAIHYALNHRDGSLELGTLKERDCRPMEFLQRVWQTTLGFPCVGFKFGRGQNPLILRSLLEDRGVRKIVLRRRNRLKTFVSELISQKTGQWEVYRQSDLLSRPKVHVDLVALAQHMAMNEEFHRGIDQYLRSSSQGAFEVWYEDLFAPAVVANLLRFLDVSPSAGELTIASVKQNPKDLRDLVSNYAELESALAGSELLRDLHSLEN